jgi:hypothetical protein
MRRIERSSRLLVNGLLRQLRIPSLDGIGRTGAARVAIDEQWRVVADKPNNLPAGR